MTPPIRHKVKKKQNKTKQKKKETKQTKKEPVKMAKVVFNVRNSKEHPIF